MWHDVLLRVEVDVDAHTVRWAAELAKPRRVGFGRTAKEALFELEQVIAADARGEDPGTSTDAARYFDADGR